MKIEVPRHARRSSGSSGRLPAICRNTAHVNFTEMSPVHLGFFRREGMQSQKRFPVDGAQGGYDTTQLNDTALIATLADHLVNACGSQPRMLI
jgi:hypothetical protein